MIDEIRAILKVDKSMLNEVLTKLANSFQLRGKEETKESVEARYRFPRFLLHSDMNHPRALCW